MQRLIFSFAIISILFSCGNNSDENNDENNESDNNNQQTEQELVIDITLNPASEFPHGCDVKGNVVDVYTWTDKNGINYFIRTIGEPEEKGAEYGPLTTQYIWAFHYVEDANGNISLLREITDFEQNCAFDLNIGHELDAISLTDIDKDEIGEISFIYRLTCTSDVSPSTQKLIMLEDGEKYALRGTTKVMDFGGEYEVGEEFETAPAGFLEHAEKLWNDNVVEYDFDL